MIMHNPLDNIMEKYSGMEVSSSTFLVLFDYDPVQCEEYLQNWVSRHENDCFVLGTNPLRIKVMLMPHDIRVYNRNILNNKRKARRMRR